MGSDKVRDLQSQVEALERRCAELESRAAEAVRAEETLRQSEARYRCVFDTGGDAFLVLDQTTLQILDANRAAIELYGYGLDELRRLKITDLSAEPEQTTEALKEGMLHIPQRHHRKKDGTVFPVEITARRALLDGRSVTIGDIRDITERKRAEETLRFTQFAVDHSADGVVCIDPTTARLISVNEAACRMMGYSREEMLSLRLFDLDPDLTESLYPSIWRQVRERGSLMFEVRHRAKDGHEVPVEVSANAIEFGGKEYDVAFWRDITERKRAEETLRLTQFAVDHSADGVAWIDPPTARLLYVNEAVCRMLGYGRDELLSMRLFDLDPDLTESRYRRVRGQVHERGTLMFEARHRAKDGRVFPFEVSVSSIEFGGKRYDVAFWRDISERRRAEEERRQFEAQIQHAQKLESLGVLAGGIAHDFNNLLTGVLGHADLALLRLPPVAPARRNLEEIEGAARRAAELCQQLLAYSGRGRFVVQALDLREVIEEMAELLELSISKKARLSCRFAPGLPPIEADVSQIRQIVMNLIINASEALGDRPGQISVATGVLECDRAYLADAWFGEGLPEGTYVYLEVTDDGCGMAPETIAKVFDPFFTTKFTGRGLGLAAVAGVVRGHRAAIKVASEAGRGTTFRVLLPALQQPVAPPLTRQTPQVPAWRGSGTVLLVDDEEIVRRLGREILEQLGFRALVAANGHEAIAVFRELRDEITCVILDLTMPHLDGVQTLQELRRMGATVPVIMASGYGEQDVAQRLSGEGIAGFLQKPYDLAEFSARLQRVLEAPGDGGGSGD